MHFTFLIVAAAIDWLGIAGLMSVARSDPEFADVGILASDLGAPYDFFQESEKAAPSRGIRRTLAFDALRSRALSEAGCPIDEDAVRVGIARVSSGEDWPGAKFWWEGLAAPLFYTSAPGATVDAGRWLDVWLTSGDPEAKSYFSSKAEILAKKKFGSVSSSIRLIAVREGVESVLVLIAIIAVSVRNRKAVWVGSALGLIASALAFRFMVFPPEYAGAAYQIALLGTFAFSWLVIASAVVAVDKRKLYLTASAAMLFGFACILREGLEISVVIRMISYGIHSASLVKPLIEGLALACVVAAAGWVFVRRSSEQSLARFSSFAMALVVFSFAGYGIRMLQASGWMPVTSIAISIPEWMGVWFGIFPTVETISAQFVAVVAIAVKLALVRFLPARLALVAFSLFLANQAPAASIWLPSEVMEGTACISLWNGNWFVFAGDGSVNRNGTPFSRLPDGFLPVSATPTDKFLWIAARTEEPGRDGGAVFRMSADGFVEEVSRLRFRPYSVVVQGDAAVAIVPDPPQIVSLTSASLDVPRPSIGDGIAVNMKDGVALVSILGQTTVTWPDGNTVKMPEASSAVWAHSGEGNSIWVACNWVDDGYSPSKDSPLMRHDWLFVKNGLIQVWPDGKRGYFPVTLAGIPVGTVTGGVWWDGMPACFAGGRLFVLLKGAKPSSSLGSYLAIDRNPIQRSLFSVVKGAPEWVTVHPFAAIGKQKAITCLTCHAEGLSDGRSWDLPSDGWGNPVNTRQLWGSYGRQPMMWRGHRPDLAAAINGGIAHVIIDKKAFGRLESFLRRMNEWGIGTEPDEFRNSCALCHDGSRPDVEGLFPGTIGMARFTPPYGHDGKWNSIENVAESHFPDSPERDKIIRWLKGMD